MVGLSKYGDDRGAKSNGQGGSESSGIAGNPGMGREIAGIAIDRFGSEIENPAMVGSANKGKSGIPGIGSEIVGIDTSKFGRFRGNEHTGSVNTGGIGRLGIGRLIPGIAIVRLGKAHFDSDIVVTMKYTVFVFCGKCQSDKDESLFCKDRYRSSGRSAYCKTCRKSWYDNDKVINPERYRERAEAARGKNNAYFIKYNEKRRELNKIANALGIDRTGVKYCASCESTPPKIRFGKNAATKDGLQTYCYDCVSIIKHNRRQALAEGRFSAKEWKAKIAFYLSCCVYCGAYLENPVIEHFVPFSKGGSSNIKNLVPSCKSCNSCKHNKDPFEWIKETFGNEHWIFTVGVNHV